MSIEKKGGFLVFQEYICIPDSFQCIYAHQPYLESWLQKGAETRVIFNTSVISLQ